MWAARYFAPRYFASRYWAKIGAVAPVVVVVRLQCAISANAPSATITQAASVVGAISTSPAPSAAITLAAPVVAALTPRPVLSTIT